VGSRLILMVAIPAILGLVLAGLRVVSATADARAYGQVSRVAALGQRVIGLAHALADERSGAAGLIAGGRTAAGAAALRQRYAATDSQAAAVRALVRQLDRSHPPARTRDSAASAMASIARLPGLRADTARGQASAVQVAAGYSAAIAGLFPVVDGIADQSDSPILITSVRALGSLSRLSDDASQEQALLGVARAAGRVGPQVLTALTTVQAREASDLADFHSSATSQESWALTRTLATPLARQATEMEQRVTAASNGSLALDSGASAQWQAGVSYTVGWMRHAEQQLGQWVVSDALAQRRNAQNSAITTGGVALGGLLLTLLIALLIVRSVVRPLRRLQADAVDAAGTRLPAEIRAVAMGADPGRPMLASPVAVAPADEIEQVARAVGRLQHEAVRMAGEQARLRDSLEIIVTGFFRRSHALHDRLLELIDTMELTEEDPERLGRLFDMDNLATRMRRHSDTALALAGHETPRRWTEPVALVDVLRAAASAIEQYDQIALDVQPDLWVSDGAAVDTVHLLAELLENAAAVSPDTAPVTVSAFSEPAGEVLIRITDAGPGMPEGQLRWLNWQLTHPGPADVTIARHMGMFAVAHLAARHDINVVLTMPPGGGTSVEVWLPAELISTELPPADGTGELGDAAGELGDGVSELEAAEPQAGAPDDLAPTLGAPVAAEYAAQDRDAQSGSLDGGGCWPVITLMIGSDAVCRDGYHGEVHGVVIRPADGIVTHVVVEPEGRRGLARLVPLDLVTATEYEVQLSCTEAEFRNLDAAEQTLAEFVPGQPDPVQVLPPGWRGAGGPTVAGGTVPRIPEQETVDTVPAGEVEEGRGEHVHATDGDVGQFRGLRVDPGSHQVTHVLVREGPVWARKEAAIPFDKIAGFDDGIRLSITRQQVRDL